MSNKLGFFISTIGSFNKELNENKAFNSEFVGCFVSYKDGKLYVNTDSDDENQIGLYVCPVNRLYESIGSNHTKEQLEAEILKDLDFLYKYENGIKDCLYKKAVHEIQYGIRKRLSSFGLRPVFAGYKFTDVAIDDGLLLMINMHSKTGITFAEGTQAELAKAVYANEVKAYNAKIKNLIGDSALS